MNIAIMQPYFFPYIGYFQLIHSVDKFVVYDNIKYTKKGWINRNRILVNGQPQLFTIPLKKDNDYLNVDKRYIAETWNLSKSNFLNSIKGNYKKAPYFEQVYSIIEKIANNQNLNLFDFIFNSIKTINEFLDIKTELLVSSTIPIDHNLKSQDKVIELCKALNATRYINAIGGIELYNKETFANKNIQLNFIKTNYIEYKQFNNNFVPWLSIIDVLMFNSKEHVKSYLNQYTLI